MTTITQDLLQTHLRLIQQTHAQIPLPPEDEADVCLRCLEYTMYPNPHFNLNPMSRTHDFEDSGGRICVLCKLEEDQRAIRKHLKSLSQKEPTND